jgi:hypothetical protein
MTLTCDCPGWGDKYQCRDGIAWDADGNKYQAHPPGEHCRCFGDCCTAGNGYNDACRCSVVTVPVTGTWLVRNGVVEQGHFDSFGRWCADDDCEITHG